MPPDGCGPDATNAGAQSTTRTTTDQSNGSTVDSTAAPVDVDLMAHALAYAREGLRVLPVHSPVGVPGAPHARAVARAARTAARAWTAGVRTRASTPARRTA